MDQDTLKNLGFAAGGAVGGILLFELFSSKNEPVYTGLTREYSGQDKSLVMSVWAVPNEGYTIKISHQEELFPDFVAPVFTAPFAAALFADDIADRLGLKPSSPWAKNTLEASAMRDVERAIK